MNVCEKEERCEKSDVEEVKEILDVVSEKIPKLIRDVMEALMNPERAREYGKAVAEFYRELVANGMPPEQAARLTEKFMDSFDFRALAGGIMGRREESPGKEDRE